MVLSTEAPTVVVTVCRYAGHIFLGHWAEGRLSSIGDWYLAFGPRHFFYPSNFWGFACLPKVNVMEVMQSISWTDAMVSLSHTHTHTPGRRQTHADTNTHTHACRRRHTQKHRNTHAPKDTETHTHVRRCRHMHTHMGRHGHTQTHTDTPTNTHTHVHTETHTHADTRRYRHTQACPNANYLPDPLSYNTADTIDMIAHKYSLQFLLCRFREAALQNGQFKHHAVAA